MEHTRVLAAFANPIRSNPLRLGAEDRVIRECITRSKYRENITLDVRHAATIHDLRRALLEENYRIVHFSGHGTGKGLAFEDEQGQVSLVPPDALAELLSTYSPPIECVILNACYSIPQGQLVSSGMPYTISMDGPISDESATEFTRGFYDAVSAGKDIEFAFQEGCRTIKLVGIAGGTTPQLFKNAMLIDKVSKSKSPPTIEQELAVGKIEWRHNAFHFVEVIDRSGRVSRHDITFVRRISEDYSPNEYDFSIEFDLTNFASTELRIAKIDVEVEGWKPLGTIICGGVSADLGRKRKYFCAIDKGIGSYPCQFEVPGGYIKLSQGEIEVIELQVNAAHEGIYDLAVSIHYSVGGRTRKIRTRTKKGLWFVERGSLVLADLISRVVSHRDFRQSFIDERFVTKEALQRWIAQARKELRREYTRQAPLIITEQLERLERWAKELPDHP